MRERYQLVYASFTYTGYLLSVTPRIGYSYLIVFITCLYSSIINTQYSSKIYLLQTWKVFRKQLSVLI